MLIAPPAAAASSLVEMAEEGNAPTNVAIPPSPTETIESNESGSASDGTALKQDLKHLKEDIEDAVSHLPPDDIDKSVEPVIVATGNAWNWFEVTTGNA